MATYTKHIRVAADGAHFTITEEHTTTKEVRLTAQYTDIYGNQFQLNRSVEGSGFDKVKALRNAYENLWAATWPACICYEGFRKKVYEMLRYYEQIDEAM